MRIMALQLLLLCSAGLFAQGTTNSKTAAVNLHPVSKSTDDQPSSWHEFLDSESATLGQVRSVFLHQIVIIDGTPQQLGGRRQLLEWRIALNPLATVKVIDPNVQNAFKQAPYVVPDELNGLPADYSGKTAKVIAVQLHNSEGSGPRINALGETVSDNETINPYFDLVAQFDDGIIAMTTQYPGTLAVGDVIELASVADATAELMKRELPSIVGKAVYAVGFSRLYRPDATLDEISQQDAFKRVSPAEVPLLEPLEIVAAKYVESAGVVIEVQLPNGKRALSLTSKTELNAPMGGGLKQTSFEKAIGLFLAEIPSSLSKKDLDAIRSGTIYLGMSIEALEYAMGLPDQENDWGSGGKQLVYGKSFFVYVNRAGAVTDWQSLDNR